MDLMEWERQLWLSIDRKVREEAGEIAFPSYIKLYINIGVWKGFSAYEDILKFFSMEWKQ